MVIYRAELGKLGRVVWETEAEDLVDHFGNPDIRDYIERELARIINVFVGAMRSPDTEHALEEFEQVVTDFARRRISRIRQLETN
jgi:transposase InsO family protein